MAYSMEKLPNDEFYFPPPATWLTWVQEWTWDHETRTRAVNEEGKGQVRQYASLARAKKHIASYVSGKYGLAEDGTFQQDWAIYEWDKDHWVARFQGHRGEARAGHPLWKRGVTDSKNTHAPVRRDATEDEIAQAIASIVKEMA